MFESVDRFFLTFLESCAKNFVFFSLVDISSENILNAFLFFNETLTNDSSLVKKK